MFILLGLFYVFWRKKKGIKSSSGTSASVNQEISPKGKKEIRDFFSLWNGSTQQADLCCSAVLLILQLFSRVRELPRCNGAHNSLFGVLQSSTKERHRARNFLQLSPNSLQVPPAVLISIMSMTQDVCQSLLSPPGHGILLFCWLAAP